VIELAPQIHLPAGDIPKFLDLFGELPAHNNWHVVKPLSTILQYVFFFLPPFLSPEKIFWNLRKLYNYLIIFFDALLTE
jgi:hypothetical protein